MRTWFNFTIATGAKGTEWILKSYAKICVSRDNSNQNEDVWDMVNSHIEIIMHSLIDIICTPQQSPQSW